MARNIALTLGSRPIVFFTGRGRYWRRRWGPAAAWGRPGLGSPRTAAVLAGAPRSFSANRTRSSAGSMVHAPPWARRGAFYFFFFFPAGGAVFRAL